MDSNTNLARWYGDIVLKVKYTEEAKTCQSPLCDGPSTIIVLDISESMRGRPFEMAKLAILRFIEGLEENKATHGLEENLGIVISRGDTFIVTHLTSDYQKIKDEVGNVKDVDGASPLISTLAVVQGMAKRARKCTIDEHTILPRAIIFSDFKITPPSFDPKERDYVTATVQKSCDDDFLENTSNLIHNDGVRIFTVPCGGKPNDEREKIIGLCQMDVESLYDGEKFQEDILLGLAMSVFDDVTDDDVEFVIKRLQENIRRPPLTKKQRRKYKPQDQIEKTEAAKNREPISASLPNSNNPPKHRVRKSLEEMLGVDSDYDEEDEEEIDLLFSLPGVLGTDGDVEKDPFTIYKIEDVLSFYGDGPPNIENLTSMPEIGTKVVRGPDWMWQRDEVPKGLQGTIIGVDKDDLGWVRVRWDTDPSRPNEPPIEEDYRFGVDNEYDVEPLKVN